MEDDGARGEEGSQPTEVGGAPSASDNSKAPSRWRMGYLVLVERAAAAARCRFGRSDVKG